MSKQLRAKEQRTRLTLIPVPRHAQAGQIDDILSKLLNFTGQLGADSGWPDADEPGWPEIEDPGWPQAERKKVSDHAHGRPPGPLKFCSHSVTYQRLQR